ncbi:MAG: hypothetical protein R3B13_38550 [Polyangiaceae bacterium]
MKVLALAVVTSTVIGCRPAPQPCMSATSCGDGHECLANRCVPSGGEPVSSKSVRTVLEPTRVAILSRRTPAGALPTVVTFGSHARGATRMMLEFAPSWRAKKVEAAFLLLTPANGVFRGNEDIDVSAWRIDEPWDDDQLSWVQAPRLVHPHGEGIARATPPSELRIDVTHIVQYFAHHPEAYRAISLTSSGGNTAGVSFATGVADGPGPRLEIYSR